MVMVFERTQNFKTTGGNKSNGASEFKGKI
jgi:hypothetical protein